jgi:hypothetical protein
MVEHHVDMLTMTMMNDDDDNNDVKKKKKKNSTTVCDTDDRLWTTVQDVAAALMSHHHNHSHSDNQSQSRRRHRHQCHGHRRHHHHRCRRTRIFHHHYHHSVILILYSFLCLMMQYHHDGIMTIVVVSATTSTSTTATTSNNTNNNNSNFWEFAQCSLTCVNGGRCRFVHGTADELSHMAQGGHLVEVCDCLPGYGGTACDLEVDECIMPDMICSNGVFCAPTKDSTDSLLSSSSSSSQQQQNTPYNADAVLQEFFAGLENGDINTSSSSSSTNSNNRQFTNADGGNDQDNQEDETKKWTCACAIADARSKFAGQMCRNPITEYCSGKYDPHSPTINFCTNGGRCESDFGGGGSSGSGSSSGANNNGELGDISIPASSSTSSSSSATTSCRCPPDFHGPHCEFFKLEQNENDDSTPVRAQIQQDTTATKSRTPGTKASITLLSFVILALVSAFVVKRRIIRWKQQQQRYHGRELGNSTNNHQVTDGGRDGTADTSSVNAMSTIRSHVVHYMDTITFSDFDEGIILPSGLNTAHEVEYLQDQQEELFEDHHDLL